MSQQHVNGIGSVALDDLPAGLDWRKARDSNDQGLCAEWAELDDDRVVLRHSTDPKGHALVFLRTEVAAFFKGVEKGEFAHLLPA
jgi:hypothetical protein